MTAQPETIDAQHRALAVVEEPRNSDSTLAIFSGEPDEIIARAVKVADALKAVIQAKGLVKKIQGREFIEVAGWQTLATLCGVTTFCEWTKEVEGGWEARVIVKRNGVDIGAAEAQCTRSESTWKSRDDYAIRSMCQTRATSKALRSVLGFLAVLAGYEDTPAAEVPDGGFQDRAPSRTARKAAPAENPAETERRRAEGVKRIATFARTRGITDERRHRITAAMFGGRESTKDLSLPELQKLSKILQDYVKAEVQNAGDESFASWLDYQRDLEAAS